MFTKKYKLDKINEAEKLFGMIFFMIAFGGSLWAIFNNLDSISVIVILGIASVYSFYVVVLQIKQLSDNNSAEYVEISIDNKKLIIQELGDTSSPKQTIFFDEIDSLYSSAVIEDGSFFGNLYQLKDSEESLVLNTRQFSNGNLDENSFKDICEELDKYYKSYLNENPIKDSTRKKSRFEDFSKGSLILILLSAAIFTLPSFWIYNKVFPQELVLHEIFLLMTFGISDFEEILWGGAPAVISWFAYFVVMIDVYSKEYFKKVYLIGFEGRAERISDTLIPFMIVLYLIFILAILDGDDIDAMAVFTFIATSFIASAYISEYKLAKLVFIPFVLVVAVNMVQLVYFLI